MTVAKEGPFYGARVYSRDERVQVTRTVRWGHSAIDEYVIDQPRWDRFVSLDDDAELAQAIRDALEGP